MPTINGTPGDDILNGTGDADTINGFEGRDIINGGGGNDTIDGGADGDIIDGGDGDDVITTGSGGSFFDQIADGAGNDTVYGGADSQFITGSAGNDYYDGGTGITVGFDFDSVSYRNALAGVIVDLTLASDHVRSSGLGDAAGIGVDTLVNIEGITGSDFDDVMTGGAGDDQFGGSAGNDVLNGGEGNDSLNGDGGDDTIDGGDGTDEAAYFSATVGVQVSLAIAGPQDTGQGIDTLTNIEDLLGSHHDDLLTGNGGANLLNGDDGNDQLFGNGGADTLGGASGNDQLFGNEGDDALLGGIGNDSLDGGDGDDFLEGGAGDDTLNGGIGLDTASYAAASGGLVISLAIAGAQNTGGGGIDTLSGIENLAGSVFADRLTGNASGNILFGGGGADFLDGAGGSDNLDGGEGGDVYVIASVAEHPAAEIGDSGASGTDEVRFAATTASTLALFAGDTGIERIVIGTGTGPDAVTTGVTAININASALTNGVTMIGNNGANILTGTAFGDTLNGGLGADRLIGNAGADRLDGGAGGDTMFGGAGDDVYVVDNAADKVIENFVTLGTDLVEASIRHTLSTNIDNLTLTGVAAINGTGNDLANILIGNSAANTLNGAGGADVMQGGLGNDIYIVNHAGDQVIEQTSEGNDLVKSSVNYTLGANIERLTLSLGAAEGTGNDLANILIGNAAANLLDGGAGVDEMRGAAGDDIYVVDHASDKVVETAVSHGNDTVLASVSYSLGSRVENLTLTGTDAINASGNAGANTLTGNGAANTLNGAAGADQMIGGGGDDLFVVDNVGDQAIELSAADGTDRVNSSVSFTLGAHLDNLTLTKTAAINGTGNGDANTLTGNSAANVLDGGGGADILLGAGGADTLDGGAGRDSLTGGTGADAFRFQDGGFAGLDTATCDVILDFSLAQGDTIQLDLVDADTGLAGDQEFAFIGGAAFGGTAGELRTEQIDGNTYLQGDTNGDSIADFLIRLDGLHTLQATDFGL